MATANKKSAKRKTRPKSAATWSLASYRRPLERVPPARSKERAQLQHVLDEEWSSTIAEAKKNDEIEIDLVDVVDPDGTTRYQLYLWSGGSGMAFEAGTTNVVAELVQHGVAPTTDDTEVAPAIAAAIAADAKRLGARERVVPSVARREPVAKPTSDATFEEAIAKAEERLAREPKPYFNEVTQFFLPWYSEFQDERPYPKRLVAELSPLQRTTFERFVAWDVVPPALIRGGLFGTRPQLARFLGQAPAGPSDATVKLDGREVPAWWAISSASTGYAKPAQVLAALGKLAPELRRAIVVEVARGEAYDLVRAHHRSPNDQKQFKERRAYWTALFTLLADLTHTDGSRETAEALLVDLPTYQFGGTVEPHPRTPRVLLALLVLAKLGPLDASLAPIKGELDAYFRRDEIYVDEKLLRRLR